MLAERQRPKRMHHDTVHVSYAGSEWLVHYDYQPAEVMTMEYPGCESDVSLGEVYLLNNPDDSEWTDRLTPKFLAGLKEATLEALGEL